VSEAVPLRDARELALTAEVKLVATEELLEGEAVGEKGTELLAVWEGLEDTEAEIVREAVLQLVVLEVELLLGVPLTQRDPEREGEGETVGVSTVLQEPE